MKILLSKKQEWEAAIALGFQATAHEAVFDEFSPTTIGNSDLVVPLTIEDAMLLNEMRSFIAGNPLPIPSRESIGLCNDKALFNRTLMANGFAHVIPQLNGVLPYPYIVKKRIDEWGKNSHVIRDAGHEQELGNVLTHPDYFRQAFIPGPTEYATHVLIKNQQIAWALNIRYVFAGETPIKGKDAILSTTLCRCPYLEQFAAILRVLGFAGLCCVNYKVLDGRLFLLEINPRFGGSLCPFLPFLLRHLH